MVQQIASLKTESAASPLPFNLSASALGVQKETRQNFDSELLRQSSANSSYERYQQTNSKENPKLLKSDSINRNYSAQSNDKNPSSTSNKTQEQRIEPKKDKVNANQPYNNYDNNTTKDETVVYRESIVESDKPAQLFLDESRTPASKNELTQNSEVKGQPEHNASDESFDYVDYISDVAEFSGISVGEGNLSANQMEQLSIDQTRLQETSDTKTIAELHLDINYKSANSSSSAKNAEEALSELKLSSVDETQKPQLQNEADVVAKAALDFAEVVNQSIGQNKEQGTSALNGDFDDFSEEDIILLNDILQKSNTQTKQSVEYIDVEQAIANRLASQNSNQVASTESESESHGVLKHIEGISEKQPGLAELLVNREDKTDILKSDVVNVVAKQTNSKQESVLIESGIKSSSDEKKTDTKDMSLRNLALLNDEQSKVALEGLTTRIQLATSSIQGEAKGNEFIAALQSGVKEFKQQLALGREPGFDLKTMVAEAIAQISDDNVYVQQPNIDATVNQFNAVVNIANATNITTSQLQTPDSETTDNQIAKEFNLKHIEGTKLANGIQNQLNTQASVDKAINIFKQEGQQKLAEKVRWMVNSKNATAEIRLDPPDLGGVNIKVNLSGDTAQVNFNVQSAAAKEALDQAAPKLREMLQEQGIELGESVVQQDSNKGEANEQSSNGEQLTNAHGGTEANLDNDIEQLANNRVVEQRVIGGVLGGIDYYA